MIGLMLRPVAIACLMAATAMPAVAGGEAVGDPPAADSGITGDWLIAPEDGRPGCHVTLSTEATIGGSVITPSPECAKALPQLAEHAAAWRFAPDGLVIADATRKAILTFLGNEWGTYMTVGEPGARLLLTKAPPGVTSLPNAKNQFGAWMLKDARGTTLCAITFQDGPPPGGEESFGLTLADGCAETVAALRLASWRFEEMNLVLYGTDGESLSFQGDGKGGWSAAESAAGAVTLTK
jgi:hypothetical protein